jgi:hypothetical protein
MQRFVEGEAWSINTASDLTVTLAMQARRLLYSDGALKALELLDPTQACRSREELISSECPRYNCLLTVP